MRDEAGGTPAYSHARRYAPANPSATTFVRDKAVFMFAPLGIVTSAATKASRNASGSSEKKKRGPSARLVSDSAERVGTTCARSGKPTSTRASALRKPSHSTSPRSQRHTAQNRRSDSERPWDFSAHSPATKSSRRSAASRISRSFAFGSTK